ncbi:hypothetical protein KM043_018651 [Ampulex compressa]|nr:hypothetical protein KM043_018651 [Ampulex compressa]
MLFLSSIKEKRPLSTSRNISGSATALCTEATEDFFEIRQQSDPPPPLQARPSVEAASKADRLYRGPAPCATRKKLVVVYPKQVRRSPTPPWRQVPTRFRKSSYGREDQHVPHPNRINIYQSRKPYKPPPFPHGGDDFDQGHEHVNHVRIPYGKNVAHAVSFGKGYIPYDNIKGSFSIEPDRHPIPKYSEPEYIPPSYTTGSGFEYHPSGGHAYGASQAESFFAEPEESGDYNERRNDGRKFYVSRSIEKDLSLRNQYAPGEKDQLEQRGVEVPQQVLHQGMQGAVLLPSGIPTATIGGSQTGIVLRDTVALDEYQKKLDELARNWPNLLVPQNVQQNVQLAGSAFSPSGFAGNSGWLANFAQPKQSYAVKEEMLDPPHDFRLMPMQSTGFQTMLSSVNMPIGAHPQTVHG